MRKYHAAGMTHKNFKFEMINYHSKVWSKLFVFKEINTLIQKGHSKLIKSDGENIHKISDTNKCSLEFCSSNNQI